MLLSSGPTGVGLKHGQESANGRTRDKSTSYFQSTNEESKHQCVKENAKGLWWSSTNGTSPTQSLIGVPANLSEEHE